MTPSRSKQAAPLAAGLPPSRTRDATSSHSSYFMFLHGWHVQESTNTKVRDFGSYPVMLGGLILVLKI
ncbi:hypothetical protein VYU27_009616 [Nannochloropsis oceanica]